MAGRIAEAWRRIGVARVNGGALFDASLSGRCSLLRICYIPLGLLVFCLTFSTTGHAQSAPKQRTATALVPLTAPVFDQIRLISRPRSFAIQHEFSPLRAGVPAAVVRVKRRLCRALRQMDSWVLAGPRWTFIRSQDAWQPSGIGGFGQGATQRSVLAQGGDRWSIRDDLDWQSNSQPDNPVAE